MTNKKSNNYWITISFIAIILFRSAVWRSYILTFYTTTGWSKEEIAIFNAIKSGNE